MLLFLLLLGADVAGYPAAVKPGSGPPPRPLAVRLRRIRQQVALIQEQRPRLHPVRPDAAQPGPEGNDLVGYFAGPALRLVHQVNAGDSGEQLTDYYFAAGRLLFIYQRETHYRVPNLPPSPPSRTQQGRYYFEQGRLFYWLGAATPARRQALLAEAQTLRRELTAARSAATPASR